MSDEELVAYVVAAGAAGQTDAGRPATNILAFRLEPLVQARIARKIGGREDREDVFMLVFESFLHSAFDGKVIGSVKAFIATITQRRIADFYRARERHPEQQALVSENQGDESIWGEEPSTEDGSELLGTIDAIERVLDRRSDLHRRMILLYGPEPMGGEQLSGAEVVERMRTDDGTEVSVDNVQQVWRRFKLELAKELSTGDCEGDPDG